jgi:RimJ/RimL family protein N-acetyltransferase
MSEQQIVSITPGTRDALVYSQWIEEEWRRLDFNDWLEGGAAPSHAPYAIAMKDNESIVAFGSIIDDDMIDRPRWNPWLACLIVARDRRGRGYGTSICRQLLAEWSEGEAEAIYLFCDPDQQAFYDRLGFHAIESREYFGSEVVTMALTRAASL